MASLLFGTADIPMLWCTFPTEDLESGIPSGVLVSFSGEEHLETTVLVRGYSLLLSSHYF